MPIHLLNFQQIYKDDLVKNIHITKNINIFTSIFQLMRIISFLSLILFLALSQNALSQNTLRVMIDAGHGGKDNGTTGLNSTEKDIVLDIAKLLKAKSNSEIELFLTRDSDTFIKLKKRALLANDNSIDLFISLHCNHINLSYVNGTEVFVYSSSSEHSDHALVSRENNEMYEDYEQEVDMSFILGEMSESAYFQQSISFGEQVVLAFENQNKLKQRGLKQANFRVLKHLEMPGILLEIAYLSNPSNEAYVLSENGKIEIAEAIWESIEKYRLSIIDSPSVNLLTNNK